MIISVSNNLDKSAQYSFTLSTVASGGTVVPVRNINPFTSQYAIQIGKTGEEQSEIVVMGSGVPSGTVLNTAGTLRYSHPLDTPVYNIKYDKIVFLRSTVGTAGTATAMTGGTVAITPDSNETIFNDSTGATTYAYQTYFLNSVTSEQSSNSAWFVPGGPVQYSLAALRQAAKDDLFDSGFIKSDDQVNRWINQWGEQMQNTAIKVNKDYALSAASVAFGTSGIGTVTSTDFKQAKKFEVIYTGGVKYTNTSLVPYNQYDENDVYSSANPQHTWTGDKTFIVLPTGQTGTARITYGNVFAPLVEDSDELSVTLRSYTTSCNEYCLYKAYDMDQKTDQADRHLKQFNGIKNDFISEITPRDQSGPQFIQIDEPLSGGSDSLEDFF